jgi:hypothetical protein
MTQSTEQGSENSLDKLMDPTTIDSKWTSPITEDGSMDRRGNPAVKTTTGGWRSAILLLGKSYFSQKKERKKCCKHLT